MNDKQLTDQLRRESTQIAPAFSPHLHRRIMNRIDAEPRRQSIAPFRSTWRSVAPLAAAAVIVAGFGIARFARHSAPAPVPPAVAARTPSIPSIPNPVRSLEAPVVKQWTDARYAEVNRDASNVVAYVARQFDVLPNGR
jgi:hypothetical protein